MQFLQAFWGMILKLAIYLDIHQRIVYKRIKSGCKESFLGRERNPQRTPNSFFAGFFSSLGESLTRIHQSESLTCIYQKLAIRQ
jgi:hypothetical protein